MLISLLSPLLVRALFFDMPAQSANFDCDDSTLFMAQRLSRIGIEATPMLGKLTATGETYSESDHVWVMANILGLRIPFDWGNLQFDSQHFEGHPLTGRQLLRFVEQDRRGQTIPANDPE
ncbi:MAG: hypothetical protein Q7T04_04445 [Dehalococcoidia bacterium]|nr:hypothetical protein [Dehalococcoidia bacterium]